MVIEIVDLPIKNGDFPSFFVCLPGRVSHGIPIGHLSGRKSDELRQFMRDGAEAPDLSTGIENRSHSWVIHVSFLENTIYRH